VKGFRLLFFIAVSLVEKNFLLIVFWLRCDKTVIATYNNAILRISTPSFIIEKPEKRIIKIITIETARNKYPRLRGKPKKKGTWLSILLIWYFLTN
jgi:hypothetical protein